jgi:hypothetical protein
MHVGGRISITAVQALSLNLAGAVLAAVLAALFLAAARWGSVHCRLPQRGRCPQGC